MPHMRTRCWVWTGYLDQDGYGEFKAGGKKYRAHRYSLEFNSKEAVIVDGLLACHECSNPPCVRPDHLYAGTFSNNMQDSYDQERRIAPRLLHPELVPRRENHPMAKLSETEVIALRDAFAFHGNKKKAWRDLAFDKITYPHAVKVISGVAW